MKNISLILLFISITATAQHAPYTVNLSSIQHSLSYLSSNELQGREFGTPGIEKAADYIISVFKKADLPPYYDSYKDHFQFNGQSGYNLIAYKEGSDPELKDELVIISAHYDHIGIQPPVQGDSIANGANDDATGTVAVLELANYFASRPTKRSILFVLFSAEEKGLIGSKHLAKRLRNESANLYTMVEFEMIGVPLKHKDHMGYLTGIHLSNFAKKFNSYAGQKVLGFFPMAKKYQLFKRSDNTPFYQLFKVPAHAISTFNFKNFEYYHKVGDEFELMNIPFMAKFIKACIPGIEGITNAEEDEIHMNS